MALALAVRLAAQEPRPAVIPFPAGPVPVVSDAEMQRVYDEVKTPFKYGVILRPEAKDELFDCPSVFRYGGHWYLLYVAIRGQVGYQTHLARSDDLLHWTPLGLVLPFAGAGWDRWQADGGAALVDPTWGGSGAIEPYDGRYWMSYLGGAKQGYEPDPLAIGLAWTTTPDRPEPWHRLAENPVLTPAQADARPFESMTLYKSTIVRDPSASLGWPFVMFYFGFRWRPHAFDTFACSPDLVHWTKWTGPNLVEPSEPWDRTFAHKPWLLMHNGVVYHFYCAVGDEGRVLALATSRDLRSPPTTSPDR